MASALKSLLFWKQCRELGVSIWSCPNFLFLLMGVITVLAMVATYFAGQHFATPEAVIPSVVLVALFIFIPGGIIVNTFEKVAYASKMKTEFVSIVSHQLRTPLSSIKWSLDLLRGDRLGESDPRQRAYLDIVQENNERMIKLVTDLLNVSRIDSGQLTLKTEKIDVKKLFEGIVEETQPLARSSNVTLSFNTKGSIPHVIGDDVYLGIVGANFIDNAIRYTPSGGQVRAELSARDSSVRFEVEDTGVGIPKKEQELIFHKFFRSRNALRRQTEGTGLGLFIAQAVIRQMQGRIGFRSQEGSGSTFWFEVPVEGAAKGGILKPKAKIKI